MKNGPLESPATSVYFGIVQPPIHRPRLVTRHLPAVVMHDATRRLREAEQYVEDMLVKIFPGWQPRHPRARGWRFSVPDAIDVYEAVDSPEAANYLHRAGFQRVTAHLHDHHASCRCRGRFAGARVGAPARAPVPTSAPAGPDEIPTGEPIDPMAPVDPSELPEIEIWRDEDESPS